MALSTGIILGSLCLEPICRATSSAQSIHSIISNISEYTTYPNIIHALKKLDIEASVRVLEQLLKELSIKNKIETLKVSVNLLKKSIIDIENELAIVHEQLAYNKTIKYFVWARSYKFTTSITKLEELKNQLDNRTRMLFLVLDNANNLAINEKNTENGEEMDISVIG